VRPLLNANLLRAARVALLVAAVALSGCATAINRSLSDADGEIERAAADDSIPSASEVGLADSGTPPDNDQP
jgi:hypothetical protein